MKDVTLSAEQVQKFKQDGYLIIENFLPASQCELLKEKIKDVIDQNLNLETHPRTLFTTYQANKAEPDAHMMTDYFLNSGDGINFFFEEGAFSNETGELACSKYHAVNKIGHALHTDVPEFKEVAQSEAVKNVCRSLEIKKPTLPQSMYIFKSPGLGGEVTPHKDNSFLHTGGTRLLGLWIPLDDAMRDNGCLWFIPGSHKEAATLFMNRKEDNTGCVFVGENNSKQGDEEYVAAEVKRGSLVLIDGDVVHKSYPNTSSRSRNAFTFHLYEGEGANWGATNWNQPTDKGTFVELY